MCGQDGVQVSGRRRRRRIFHSSLSPSPPACDVRCTLKIPLSNVTQTVCLYPRTETPSLLVENPSPSRGCEAVSQEHLEGRALSSGAIIRRDAALWNDGKSVSCLAGDSRGNCGREFKTSGDAVFADTCRQPPRGSSVLPVGAPGVCTVSSNFTYDSQPN